jgi:hypothetical protein
VERGAFPRPEVRERLEKHVLLRMWYENDDVYKLMETRFGTTSIPLYVELTADDEVVGTLVYPGGSLDPFVGKLVPLLDEGLRRAGK